MLPLAIILTGTGKKLFSRIYIIPTDLPIELEQFPLTHSFAMAINKEQGKSFKISGLNMIFPYFLPITNSMSVVLRLEPLNNLFLLVSNGKSTNAVYPKAVKWKEYIICFVHQNIFSVTTFSWISSANIFFVCKKNIWKSIIFSCVFIFNVIFPWTTLDLTVSLNILKFIYVQAKIMYKSSFVEIYLNVYTYFHELFSASMHCFMKYIVYLKHLHVQKCLNICVYLYITVCIYACVCIWNYAKLTERLFIAIWRMTTETIMCKKILLTWTSI